MKVRDLLKPKSSEEIKATLLELDPNLFHKELIREFVAQAAYIRVDSEPARLTVEQLLDAWIDLGRGPALNIQDHVHPTEDQNWPDQSFIVAATDIVMFSRDTALFTHSFLIEVIPKQERQNSVIVELLQWYFRSVKNGKIQPPTTEEIDAAEFRIVKKTDPEIRAQMSRAARQAIYPMDPGCVTAFFQGLQQLKGEPLKWTRT